jgi:hypothetical protein
LQISGQVAKPGILPLALLAHHGLFGKRLHVGEEHRLCTDEQDVVRVVGFASPRPQPGTPGKTMTRLALSFLLAGVHTRERSPGRAPSPFADLLNHLRHAERAV